MLRDCCFRCHDNDISPCNVNKKCILCSIPVSLLFSQLGRLWNAYLSKLIYHWTCNLALMNEIKEIHPVYNNQSLYSKLCSKIFSLILPLHITFTSVTMSCKRNVETSYKIWGENYNLMASPSKISSIHSNSLSKFSSYVWPLSENYTGLGKHLSKLFRKW